MKIPCYAFTKARFTHAPKSSVNNGAMALKSLQVNTLIGPIELDLN